MNPFIGNTCPFNRPVNSCEFWLYPQNSKFNFYDFLAKNTFDQFGQGEHFNEIFEVFLRLEGLNQKILLRKKVLEFNFMVL